MPSPIKNTAAMPAINTPWLSANTDTTSAPEKGRNPTPSTTASYSRIRDKSADEANLCSSSSALIFSRFHSKPSAIKNKLRAIQFLSAGIPDYHGKAVMIAVRQLVPRERGQDSNSFFPCLTCIGQIASDVVSMLKAIVIDVEEIARHHASNLRLKF